MGESSEFTMEFDSLRLATFQALIVTLYVNQFYTE